MPKTLKHFNGDEEAFKQYYRDLQKKSRRTYKGDGGFSYLKKHNPDKLKALSSQGGKKSKRGAKTNQPTQSNNDVKGA